MSSDALVPSDTRQRDRDTQTDSPLRTNHSQQMDCGHVECEVQNLREELHKVKKELAACKFGFGIVEGDDKKTHYYTDLASWVLFLHVFNFLSSHVKHSRRVMTPMDQFFLNCLGQTSARFAFPRYGISICSEFGYNHQHLS